LVEKTLNLCSNNVLKILIMGTIVGTIKRNKLLKTLLSIVSTGTGLVA